MSAVSSIISCPSSTSASLSERGDAGEGGVEGMMTRGRSMGLDGLSLAGELGLVPMDRTEQGEFMTRLSAAHRVDAVATRGEGHEGFLLGDERTCDGGV